jgi:hypothetical protein
VPLLGRLAGVPWRVRDVRTLVAAAVVGLVVDVSLKALVAPVWRQLLLYLVGW